MWARQDAVCRKKLGQLLEINMSRDIRTKYFPTFAETLPVLGIDDIDDGVAISIVPMPDIANASLTT